MAEAFTDEEIGKAESFHKTTCILQNTERANECGSCRLFATITARDKKVLATSKALHSAMSAVEDQQAIIADQTAEIERIGVLVDSRDDEHLCLDAIRKIVRKHLDAGKE